MTWDEEIAKRHCREIGVNYLSHETYQREIWIAVEDWSGRYEIKIPWT